MQRAGEENIDVRRKIIVFYVVDYFESVCYGRADSELRFGVALRAHFLPDFLVMNATIELRVFEKSVEVFWG